MSRLKKRFDALRAENRAGLVTYMMSSDPDQATSQAILNGLPKAGVDVIEFGIAFTDPMADGPAIQQAALRALASGVTLKRTLSMVAEFRKTEQDTPVVLMGYYNPVYAYGIDAFVRDAVAAGVDGLILVDMPPEEAPELMPAAREHGLDFIVLTTPTSDDKRLPVILENASGFVYYVSIAGITGTASANVAAVQDAVARIKRHTDLPVVVGFGIKTAAQAAEFAKFGDAVVVGSAIVQTCCDAKQAGQDPVQAALSLVSELAQGVRKARL